MTESPPADAVSLPAFDPEQAEIVRSPEQPRTGYWTGCPSVRYDASRSRFVMTYRQRRPRGHGTSERGWRCAVAVSDDGRRFEDVWAVEKGQLGTPSMERFCVDVAGDTGYRLFLSYVDPEDNRWRIDSVTAERLDGFDIARRTPVLTAQSTGTEGVKDPYLMRMGTTAYLFVSYAQAGTFDQARAHATADIYNVGVTTCPTGLAVSENGDGFSWKGNVLEVGAGWDSYQARLNSVAALPDGGYLGFYDGAASVAENYEEHCGLVHSNDLTGWRRLTPEAPWVTGASGSGSVRYLDVVDLDGTWWIYFEATRPDGAHELRLARVPAPAAGGGGDG